MADLETRVKQGAGQSSARRLIAIATTARLGKKIQKDFPHIAQDYREGKFASEIVEAYRIDNEYGVPKSKARKAVYQALRGYSGGLNVEPYSGLIRKKELDRISKGHLRELGRTNGATRTLRIANAARGVVLWTDEERSYALAISKLPTYRHSRPSYQGFPDNKRIADELNKRFHSSKPVRTRHAARVVIARFSE